MGKKKKISLNNNSSKITFISTLLVAFTSIIIAYNANMSTKYSREVFDYTKKINVASIDLIHGQIKNKIINNNKFKTICLYMKNTGNESLHITSTSMAYFNFINEEFEYIYKGKYILNALNPNSISAAHEGTVLIKNEIINMAIIMKVDFETISKAKSIIYYYKVDGAKILHDLNNDEYKLMESHIPKEFKIRE